jgi:ferredoxin-NADP reductase
MVAPTVRHLAFDRDDGQPLDFIPGQFLQVHFEYDDGSPPSAAIRSRPWHDHALQPGEGGRDRGVLRAEGGAATALFEALAPGERCRPAARTAASACATPTRTRATC